MSVLRKIPYIEEKIGALTSVQITALKSVINSTGGADAVYNLETLRTHCSEARIEAITLEYNGTKSGFLIYNGTWCVFLAYHQFPSMQIFEITLTDLSVKEIKEELTVEELRRVVAVYSDTGETAWETALKQHLEYSESADTIEADEVTSDNVIVKDELEFYDSSADFGTNAKARIKESALANNEDSGKVPTSDGDGGVNWQYPSASNISSGIATNGQVLKANGSGGTSWGDVVVPTVDQTYNASSTNAQSGVAVASAIASAITTTLGGNY